MSRELTIMAEVLRNPNLMCFNVRYDESNKNMIAATLSMKNGSCWVKGEGKTVSEAILSLESKLNEKGIALETRPVTVTTQPTMPGFTRNRMPGM